MVLLYRKVNRILNRIIVMEMLTYVVSESFFLFLANCIIMLLGYVS